MIILLKLKRSIAFFFFPPVGECTCVQKGFTKEHLKLSSSGEKWLELHMNYARGGKQGEVLAKIPRQNSPILKYMKYI